MENTATTTYPQPIGSPPANFNINGNESFSPSATTNGTTFLLAPGGERGQQKSSVDPNTMIMDYTTDFPELPGNNNINQPNAGAWRKPPSVKANVVTQVFHLPMEERANRSNKNQFGNTSEEQQKCNGIASATNTTIELSEARDQTLTILITGKRAQVEDARTRIVRELQTQAHREISIPKEHHRVIIGKEGATLRCMESETDCRVFIPGRDSASDMIKVMGPREGIDKALHQIQLISDEQSKLAQEYLMIERIYYPWIRGPFNEIMDKLIAETGAKINIPPPSAKSEVVIVTGEKEGVYKAAKIIRDIYEEKQNNVKSVTCKVARAQHRYVIGQHRSGLAEILRETGVSVEVPPEETDSDTITLRGDPSKLGDALSLVYQKASSVITAEVLCPAWLHKFLIGPRGQTLQQVVPNKPKVQIDFEEGGTIYLEGPPEEVKIAQTALNAAAERFKMEMATEKIKVHPNYHRHVIGKGGSFITKLKNETGVQILIPNESTNSDEIVVEGKKEGVAKAAAEIMEIVKKLENEKSRDIVIEQRLHKQIIGTKGESIQKLRDQYPSLIFGFPEPGRKSDLVSLRGDKQEVDKCYKQLAALVKELQESNFQLAVPIFKDFHKHIIGKGGATVRKIREETTTRIDLPGEGSGEDRILVTGKKANVEKAVQMLTQIQNELASIVTLELKIAAKIHPRLLGGGRRLIQDIQDQCGGVHIKFPPEKSSSDKVTIRGPREDAERAEKLLTDLAKDRELSSFEDSVCAKPEFHRFLIGKGGSKIKKVREGFPDVRVLFPRETDKEQDQIHLVGRKEEVAQVKKQLEILVTELNEISEVFVNVPMKWHRHFVGRGASVLREIQEHCGGVSVSFPRQNTNDTKVTIKGAKDCCEAAKIRIDEIVGDLEAQVNIQVSIPSQHHRALLSNRGQKIQDICAKYSVQIKFPEREKRDESSEESKESSAADLISLSGRIERCEEAKKALLACVPVTEAVEIPFDFHGQLIGSRGEAVRSLMQTFDVSISIPPADQQLNEIKVQGAATNVNEAVKEIKVRLEEWNLQAQDRELRNFKLSVQVPAQYHQRLIGPRGTKINELRRKHDVQISIPKQTEGSEVNETVVITGYENKANECREEIEAMIGQLENLFTQEITLDARVHPRIIGQKGRNIKKVMDEFKVEINFPKASDPDPNLVSVSGNDNDSVYDCIDHLRNIEEEHLQEITERSHYMSSSREEAPSKAIPNSTMHIQNAPWDASNMEDFPSMGIPSESANNNASASSGVWGSGRRF